MATASVPNNLQNGTINDATQVDANFASLVTFLNASVIQSDGSIAATSPLVLSGDPTSALHAADKAYVDGETCISSTGVSQVFTGGTPLVCKFGTPALDTASGYSTSTGLYTCTRGGIFLVEWQIAPTLADNVVYSMYLYRNGSAQVSGPTFNPSVVGATAPIVQMTTILQLTAADTINPEVKLASTLTRTLGDRLSITRLHG